MRDKTNKSELKWLIAWAVVIVLASSLPYIIGLVGTPPGYRFLGLTHNIDDGAVYLSWMRQASDGHFFISNQFTNQPQTGRQFNVLFLLMGWVARLGHLPLIWVYHIFRLLLGIGTILLVYKFAGLFLDKAEQRRALIPIVGLSAGIGWLIPGAHPPTGPVDIWQPEAITFLSIYLNPLFLAGLILILGSMYHLVLAQRHGRARNAVYAGLLLLLLGNVHTYDVITVGCVWASYIVVLWAVGRRFPTRTVLLSALTALIALPSAAYQFHLYRVDDVFRARANSATPSPEIWAYFAGYGLVLLGAAVGAVLWEIDRREAHSNDVDRRAPNPLLLFVWAVVGFAIPYIPVGQQRKLVMGLHVPLCILCAYGLTRLLANLPTVTGRLALTCFVALSAVSNMNFIASDANAVVSGLTAPGYPPYISLSELDAMDYIRDHAKPTDSVFAPPGFALFVPALAGRKVYYGHWSETPYFAEAIRQWRDLGNISLPNEAQQCIISTSQSAYYVSTDRRWDPRPSSLKDHMSECYRNGDVRVYRLEKR